MKGHELIFAHEVAHILGAGHNREQSPEDKYDTYSHGFLMKGSPYHTVMAYRNNDLGFTRWVPYFSMMAQTTTGIPFGDAKSDNRRKLTETR
jgi:hypothetical protein